MTKQKQFFVKFCKLIRNKFQFHLWMLLHFELS